LLQIFYLLYHFFKSFLSFHIFFLHDFQLTFEIFINLLSSFLLYFREGGKYIPLIHLFYLTLQLLCLLLQSPNKLIPFQYISNSLFLQY
jgi:hypothetical protein